MSGPDEPVESADGTDRPAREEDQRDGRDDIRVDAPVALDALDEECLTPHSELDGDAGNAENEQAARARRV